MSGLQVYAPLLALGTWMTIKLALISLLLSLFLGLLGAGAKLSTSRAARWMARLYTTLIRGVPDLVLMLLIFYGLQTWLGQLTDRLGWAYLEIDAFTAGVMTLGFIYGAYFTETLRGAILAVPFGQIEAARAYGLSPMQCFCRVLFPQMMRFALPGLGNNWLVLLKSTAIVSLIGLSDMTRVADQAGRATHQPFTFYLAVCVLYLALTALSGHVLGRLTQRYSAGVREAHI